MNRILSTTIALALASAAAADSAQAAGFVYRGILEEHGEAAEGRYEFRLQLHATPGGVAPLAAPLHVNDVEVAGGRFAVDIDLGAHRDGWLEVAVRADGDAGWRVLPQRLAVDGTAGSCPASWLLAGNAGSDPAFEFLGTTDGTPLTLRVNNAVGWRLVPASTPAVLGGHAANTLGGFAVGGTIAGGGDPASPNSVQEQFGSIGGGRGNVVTAQFGTIGGGRANQAAGGVDSTVGGGASNLATGQTSTVGGGFDNRATALTSTIGGGRNHRASGTDSTIAGGIANQATASLAAVGGGSNNFATAIGARIGGGRSNSASGIDATVGGGNANAATANNATIGGGQTNDADGPSSTVAGGFNNTAGGPSAAVGGGSNNAALGTQSTIAGGTGNLATADRSTIAGGGGNTVRAAFGFVAGGEANCAGGRWSFVGGRRAKTKVSGGDFGGACTLGTVFDSDGAFVWADSTDVDFVDYGRDSFAVRATGGIYLVTAVNASGSDTAGVRVPPGASGWVSLSDRAAKSNIEAIDPASVLDRLLALPLYSWRWNTETDDKRHLGPMAQDFHAAFGLNGDDDRHIMTLDSVGVALAAIQGLNARLEADNAALRDENAALAAAQQQLAARLERLEDLQAEVSALRAALTALHLPDAAQTSLGVR
jgi:trimeric autotransporter adhesin